jgi:hypothetical protein
VHLLLSTLLRVLVVSTSPPSPSPPTLPSPSLLHAVFLSSRFSLPLIDVLRYPYSPVLVLPLSPHRLVFTPKRAYPFSVSVIAKGSVWEEERRRASSTAPAALGTTDAKETNERTDFDDSNFTLLALAFIPSPPPVDDALGVTEDTPGLVRLRDRLDLLLGKFDVRSFGGFANGFEAGGLFEGLNGGQSYYEERENREMRTPTMGAVTSGFDKTQARAI